MLFFGFLSLLIFGNMISKGYRRSRNRRLKRSSARSVRSGRSSASHGMYEPSAKLKAYQKQQEREKKEREKAAKAAHREKELAEKKKLSREMASSDLEFIRHRMEQLLNLIEIAEEKQEGTLYGGKEWLKYERDIMKYENQYHALAQKEHKARAVRDRK